MLHMYLYLTIHLPDRLSRSWRRRGEEGQATAEYALILLTVAAVATALFTWVTRTDPLEALFNVVLGKLLGWAKK